jgi:hypothetical protein
LYSAKGSAQPPAIKPAPKPLFVRLSKWGGRAFRGLARGAALNSAEEGVFNFLSYEVSAQEYHDTYRGITIYGFSAGLLAALLVLLFSSFDGPIKLFISAVFLLAPIFAGYLYKQLPFYDAEREKKLALAYTPEIVNYLVMSMRLTPNLEKAVEFAAAHGRGKIAEDLKEILWRTQLGTYYSIEEGLDDLAYRWGPYSDDFKHALMLVRSSVMEADAPRRGEMLERAATDVLEGSKEKMDIYARQLHQPTVYLYYFGILLPLMLAIILPITGAMTGLEVAKAEYVFLFYNILIPIGIYVYGSNILGSRPPTYVPPEIPEDYPLLPRKGILEIGSMRLPYKPLSMLVFAALVGAGFILDKLVVDSIPAYKDLAAEIARMPHIAFLYDDFNIFAGQFTIAGTLLGLSLSISLYLYGKYSARKRVQDEIRGMETEFKDALYVLASRLGENRPMEEALKQAVEFLPKSKVASDMFKKILENIASLGMTLEAAIFDPTYGAMRYYPSQMMRGGLRIMTDSVELGVNVAAKSLISLSMQIRNQQKIDEMLRKLLSDVTLMLSTMAEFIAPIVLAVVSALQQMVTGALSSSCANQFEAGSAPASQALGGFSMGSAFCNADIRKVAADPATFVLIMGVYSIELVILLTYFNSQVEDTNNELHTCMSVAGALPVATFLYVATAFVVANFVGVAR